MAPERAIYIARRHPALDRAAFIPRWRQHWALVGAMVETASVRRYAQCEVLHDTHPQPRDGVATSEFFSPELRAAIRNATEFRRIAHADERETFETLVGEHLFIARFHVLAGSGTGPFKIVRFVRRRPGLEQSDFFDRWRYGDYVPGLLAAPPTELLGYAQNHVIEPDLVDAWTMNADGAEEFFFADLAAARRFLDSTHLAHATDRGGLFDDGIDAVITNEVILKDVR